MEYRWSARTSSPIPARPASRSPAFLIALVLVPFAACGDKGGPTKPSEQTITCVDVAAPAAPARASLWTQLSPVGASAPAARWQHGAGYDVRNDRLIVYGGTGASGVLGDVWVLLNASGRSGPPTWTSLNPSGTPPAARRAAVVAYDSARNRLLVYGGADANNYILTDLWVLSDANGLGSAPTWTRMPVTPTPEVIGRRAFGYDARADRLQLFGGLSCGSGYCTLYSSLASLRNLSGAVSYATESAPGPSARSSAVGAYDAVNGRLFVVGGNTSAASPQNRDVIGEAWALLGAGGSGALSWRAAPTLPDGREYHNAVYDTRDGRVVVFGGVGLDNYVRNDVWLLDGAGTLQTMQWLAYATQSSSRPKARSGAAAVYVPGSNLLLVYGGNSGNNTLENDVWVLKLTPPGVASVSVLSSASEVCVGNTLGLTGVAKDSAGNVVDATITWSSDNPGVVTVDANGVVIPVSAGTASVTATSGSVSSQKLSVRVRPAPAQPGGGTNPSSGLGLYNQGTLEGCVDTYNDRTTNIGAITLMAYGGAPLSGYTWSLTSGYTFPAGTTVEPLTGIFKATGARLVAGNYTLHVTVSDGSRSGNGTIPVSIGTASSAPQNGIPMPGCPAAVFQQGSAAQIQLADAKAGSGYGSSLFADVGSGQNGGTLPLSWYLATGSLPGGLTIDQGRGIVRGTPFSSAAGQTYRFTIRVQDAAGRTAICPNGGTCPTYIIAVK